MYHTFEISPEHVLQSLSERPSKDNETVLSSPKDGHLVNVTRAKVPIQ